MMFSHFIIISQYNYVYSFKHLLQSYGNHKSCCWPTFTVERVSHGFASYSKQHVWTCVSVCLCTSLAGSSRWARLETSLWLSVSIVWLFVEIPMKYWWLNWVTSKIQSRTADYHWLTWGPNFRALLLEFSSITIFARCRLGLLSNKSCARSQVGRCLFRRIARSSACCLCRLSAPEVLQ